jgi:hypothetical protein
VQQHGAGRKHRLSERQWQLVGQRVDTCRRSAALSDGFVSTVGVPDGGMSTTRAIAAVSTNDDDDNKTGVDDGIRSDVDDKPEHDDGDKLERDERV